MQRSGQLWFVAQFVLFCAILVAPLVAGLIAPFGLVSLGLSRSLAVSLWPCLATALSVAAIHLGPTPSRAGIW